MQGFCLIFLPSKHTGIYVLQLVVINILSIFYDELSSKMHIRKVLSDISNGY